jgi:hypothetical protein
VPKSSKSLICVTASSQTFKNASSSDLAANYHPFIEFGLLRCSCTHPLTLRTCAYPPRLVLRDSRRRATESSITLEFCITAALLPRRVTAKSMVYAIHAAFIPKDLYCCKASLPTLSFCKALDRKIRVLVKQKLGTSMYLPTSCLHSPSALSLCSFEDSLTEQALPDLQIGLSSPGLLGSSHPIARIAVNPRDTLLCSMP